ESAIGGGLALLKDGDVIRLDLNTCRVDVLISDEELAQRRAAWQPPKLVNQTPWEEIYRNTIGQHGTGACMEPATLYLNIIETRGEARDSH
ncbi:MAG TPA: dihydroxy-acid dehydratase, partial [Castellaniella sp.]|nr:dihydroxy-acid dehydratase [Castellaniella sp.]